MYVFILCIKTSKYLVISFFLYKHFIFISSFPNDHNVPSFALQFIAVAMQISPTRDYSGRSILVFYSIIFRVHCRLTHPFGEEELISQRPVIHAQAVGEDEGLEGVGHDVFLGQEVVAEELLHPVAVAVVQ